MDMESSDHHKEYNSKASIEDIEPPEQVDDDDDTGTGRPYECMFCRRGFSSAQALGGHMNIHRRDRARIRQPPRPDHEETSENSDYLQRHQNYRAPVHPPTYEPPRGYPIYFPGGSSSSAMAAARETRPRPAEGGGVWQRRRELRLFGGDLHLGLGVHVDGNREDGRRRQGEEDGGLDLELRLGHHEP